MFYFLSFESSISIKHILTVARNVQHIDCCQVRLSLSNCLTYYKDLYIRPGSGILLCLYVRIKLKCSRRNSCNRIRFIVAFSNFSVIHFYNWRPNFQLEWIPLINSFPSRVPLINYPFSWMRKEMHWFVLWDCMD